MKHSVLGWVCVFALVALPLMGCSSDNPTNPERPPCTQDSQCDDGNACTSDTCPQFECRFSPMDGSACAGGAGVCSSAGECVECARDSDCDDDNDCTSDTCGGSACLFDLVDGGSACTRGGVPGTCSDGVCFAGGMGGSGGTGGSAGTGGAGGAADVCDLGLPEPASGSGLHVDVYATFDTRQAAISFDVNNTLFAGNLGVDATPDPVPVLGFIQDGAQIDELLSVLDPDALVVDVGGVFAAGGNVLIGGVYDIFNSKGQITEMTPDGTIVGQAVQDDCFGNINHLMFDRTDQLIVTNFEQATVCAVKDGTISELINLADDIPGSGPASLTVQDPNTGMLYVTSEGSIHQYDELGGLQNMDYIAGSALAYGPGPDGSVFKGLLIRRGATLLVRSDPDQTTEVELLTGRVVGGFIAFDGDGNLYISDAPNPRVIRVSTIPNLPSTAVGCD